jgi:hypothetical protein
VENKLRTWVEGQRKNVIMIFGLLGEEEANYFDTIDMEMKWLCGPMKAEVAIVYVCLEAEERSEFPINSWDYLKWSHR